MEGKETDAGFIEPLREAKATLPLVSVIIPTYNNEATLGEAIASAQRQTLSNIEIVVVDDGSTDDTPNIIRNLAAQDSRIKSIRLAKNSGVSHGRNTAIKHASGEWIAVLDADDIFEPPRLEKMVVTAKKIDADVLCDNLKMRDFGSFEIVAVTKWHEGGHITALTPRKLFHPGFPIGQIPIGWAKPLIKASFLEKNRLSYDERISLGEDYLFLAEIFLDHGRVFFMPEAHYIYLRRVSRFGKVSSGFFSLRGWDDLIKLCNVLLEKYAEKLSNDNRRQILKRRKIVTDWIQYMKFRNFLREKKVAAAVALFFRTPVISIYLIFAVVRKVRIISEYIIDAAMRKIRRMIAGCC